MTWFPQQSIRQRLMHARCLLRMQSAEMERRKCVEAGPYQLGTPHSPAAVDNPQDCASRDTQCQAGGCSPQPRLVWTPELDQRFVEAVEQLGPKTATPKTILQVVSHPLLLLSLPSSYTQQHFTCPPTKQEIHLIKPPGQYYCSLTAWIYVDKLTSSDQHVNH